VLHGRSEATITGCGEAVISETSSSRRKPEIDRRSENQDRTGSGSDRPPELIGLATERDLDNPDGYLGNQASGDNGARTTSRVVTFKHRRYLVVEVLLEQRLLLPRKRTSH
jgi:hypothetical protein